MNSTSNGTQPASEVMAAASYGILNRVMRFGNCTGLIVLDGNVHDAGHGLQDGFCECESVVQAAAIVTYETAVREISRQR